MKKSYTKDELIELFVCSKDLMYFAEEYVIKNDQYVDRTTPVNLRMKQRLWLNCSLSDKYVDLGDERSTGKTSTFLSRALWEAFFHSDKTIVYVGHNQRQAESFRSRVSSLVEILDKFAPKVIKNNRDIIRFDNGSKILFTGSANPSVLKGRSINLLLLDDTNHHKDIVEMKNCSFPAIGTHGRVMESK